jgi:hypothetical protein
MYDVGVAVMLLLLQLQSVAGADPDSWGPTVRLAWENEGATRAYAPSLVLMLHK